MEKDHEEVDDNKEQSLVQDHGGDRIKLHKNPPLASHMGDV